MGHWNRTNLALLVIILLAPVQASAMEFEGQFDASLNLRAFSISEFNRLELDSESTLLHQRDRIGNGGQASLDGPLQTSALELGDRIVVLAGYEQSLVGFQSTISLQELGQFQLEIGGLVTTPNHMRMGEWASPQSITPFLFSTPSTTSIELVDQVFVWDSLVQGTQEVQTGETPTTSLGLTRTARVLELHNVTNLSGSANVQAAVNSISIKGTGQVVVTAQTLAEQLGTDFLDGYIELELGESSDGEVYVTQVVYTPRIEGPPWASVLITLASVTLTIISYATASSASSWCLRRQYLWAALVLAFVGRYSFNPRRATTNLASTLIQLGFYASAVRVLERSWSWQQPVPLLRDIMIADAYELSGQRSKALSLVQGILRRHHGAESILQEQPNLWRLHTQADSNEFL